jgi:hypothetical protein
VTTYALGEGRHLRRGRPTSLGPTSFIAPGFIAVYPGPGTPNGCDAPLVAPRLRISAKPEAELGYYDCKYGAACDQARALS